MRPGAVRCRGLFLLCCFGRRSALSTQTQAGPGARENDDARRRWGRPSRRAALGQPVGWGPPSSPNRPPRGGPSRSLPAALKVAGGGRTGEPSLPHRCPASSPLPSPLPEGGPEDRVPRDSQGHPRRCLPGPGCGPRFGGAQGSGCMLDPSSAAVVEGATAAPGAADHVQLQLEPASPAAPVRRWRGRAAAFAFASAWAARLLRRLRPLLPHPHPSLLSPCPHLLGHR